MIHLSLLSNAGIYGAYTEINHGHISLELIREIPDILPNTGILIFDTRHDKTWRTELDEYLAQKKDYTGIIFDYDRLWHSIENFATQFVQEIQSG